MPGMMSQIGPESNGVNRIFANLGEKYLEHLFITSSGSYFFNKTDFEQHLFNSKKATSTFPSHEFVIKSDLIFLCVYCTLEAIIVLSYFSKEGN